MNIIYPKPRKSEISQKPVNPRRGTAIDSRSPSIVCWYVGDQRSGVMTPFRDSDRDCNLENENVAASGRPEIVAVTGALENIMTAMAHWYLSLSRMQWQDQTRGTTPDSSALGTPFPCSPRQRPDSAFAMTVFQTCTIHIKSTYTCFLLVAQITILRECCPALGATPADLELPKDAIAIRETAILRYEPTTGTGIGRALSHQPELF